MAVPFWSASSCSTLTRSSRTRSNISFAVRSEMTPLQELPQCDFRNDRDQRTAESFPTSFRLPVTLASFSHSRWSAPLPRHRPARFSARDGFEEPGTENRFPRAVGLSELLAPHPADSGPWDTSHFPRKRSENPCPCRAAPRPAFPRSNGRFRPSRNSASPAPGCSGNRATLRGNG